MSDEQFDQFSKALSTHSSRGQFLKLLGGGALGVTLGLIGILDASAARSVAPLGNGKCPMETIKCGGVCCFRASCVKGQCIGWV